jgi:hypothetical protein
METLLVLQHASATTFRERLLPQGPAEMLTSFRDNQLLELLKNEFTCIPENRIHGGGVCYTVRLTYITRGRTQAELKQSYFEPVLVQEPTVQVGQTFKWYCAEDSILRAHGMKL